MDKHIDEIGQWLGTGAINIFGRPFSGKDTQGELLAKLFGGELIGGGDILRSHHDPKKIEDIMASGGIIPSDFYEQMVLPYLARKAFAHKPLILSSVGRSHGEEPVILRAAAAAGHPIKTVLLLKISEEEVWGRFEESLEDHDRGNRSDDRRDVLKTRLQKFQEKTAPVIEFYRDKGLLIEIDGAKSREAVTEEILTALARCANSA